MRPIKSPCFDMYTYKAPASSSLKERIKLNKKITVSSKDGKLIGTTTQRYTARTKDTNVYDMEVLTANASNIPTISTTKRKHSTMAVD